MKKNNSSLLGSLIGISFSIAIATFLIIGEIMCIVNCIRSDWQPSYKREIIYGVAAVTGLGSIVGWFNIQDKKEDAK